MKLYRAVSQVELADIRAHDSAFRDSPHLSGEKGFFYERKDAARIADWASGDDLQQYSIVSTEAPDEVIERGRTHTATHEGPGVYLLVSDLYLLSPAVEV